MPVYTSRMEFVTSGKDIIIDLAILVRLSLGQNDNERVEIMIFMARCL